MNDNKIIIRNRTEDLSDTHCLIKAGELLRQYEQELKDYNYSAMTFGGYVCIFRRWESGTMNFEFRDHTIPY